MIVYTGKYPETLYILLNNRNFCGVIMIYRSFFFSCTAREMFKKIWTLVWVIFLTIYNILEWKERKK